MKTPSGITKIVDCLRYSVDASTLLADGNPMGCNYEVKGFLYRTANWRYFFVTVRCGDHYVLQPVSKNDAIDFFTHIDTNRYATYEAAFSNTAIRDT